MNKSYRIFSCSLFVILLSLEACTSVSASSGSTAAGEAAQPTASSSPTQIVETLTDVEEIDVDLPSGITLEFWHPWTGEMEDLYEEITADFNRTNAWGIEVNLERHGDENVLLDNIVDQAQEAAGDLPDIVAAPSQSLQLWYQQGVPLRDLSEFIDLEEGGLSAEKLNTMLPIFWKSDLVDNVRLGIPLYRTGYFLFYNQSWAQELGFTESPETSAEFEKQSCAAAQVNLEVANGTGGWFYDDSAMTILSWMQAFSGTGLAVAYGENEVDFQKAGNQTGLEFIYDLYFEDCAWQGQQSTPYEYFAERYALFYSGSSEDIFIQEAANLEEENGDNWVLLPYPSDDYRPVVFVNGWSCAILSDDPDRSLAAWLFLRYLLDVDTQVKVVEDTGSLPLSNEAINALVDFRADHPAWNQVIKYIALAQSVSQGPLWIQVEPVLADMAWQLRQYTIEREDIPRLLTEADAIIQSMNE